ncbi:MAG TPA: helix-turn-helix transcriptional regulator [Candidatus Micrarchaeaceae archaeon]|nr:helix-turn-helix transcriptional regulator [Candidatus Micrarchaeaceae archaeon]
MVSGDLLVEARRRAGISQAELGRRSGVPPSLIGRYERYEVTPSLERLRFLITAAGFELSIRLARVDPSNHDQVLIERELRRTPAERLRRGLMAGRKLGALARRPHRARA